MGTSSMFYGLTQIEEEYYGHFMNKFIGLAPCIYLEPIQHYEYVDGIDKMRKLGINVISGPDWDSHVNIICDSMSESWCKFAKNKKSKQPVSLKSYEWVY